MIPRDWTLTDQACAADDERGRRWWKNDPFADPDYREGPEQATEDDAHPSHQAASAVATNKTSSTKEAADAQ